MAGEIEQICHSSLMSRFPFFRWFDVLLGEQGNIAALDNFIELMH
jgi:hypothetical protein